MGIPLGEPQAPRIPVVKRERLGEIYKGALINIERRNRQRRDPATRTMVDDINPNTGKPRQELVLTFITMPGTTAKTGIGEDSGVPDEGDQARAILKGKSYADWIEQEQKLGRQVQVGDFYSQRTTHGQAYNQDGDPVGDPLTTQEQIDAVPRTQTLGIYFEMKLEAGEGEWVDKAEAAYRAANATTLSSASTTSTGEPFPADDAW